MARLLQQTIFTIGFSALAFACSEGSGTADDGMNSEPDVTSEPDTSEPDATSEPDSMAAAEELLDVTEATWMGVGEYDWAPKTRLNDDMDITVDDGEGDPAPSLRIEVPFSDYQEFIDFEFTLDATEDLTGKCLLMPLELVEGGNTDPMCPGGIRFYAKTGDDYAYGQATWTNFPTAGSWRRIAFDVDNAEVQDGVSFDPTDVRIIGLGLETADCGGAFEDSPSLPEPAVFLIDNFEVVDASECR